jgi:hypothetical protein
MLIKKDFRLISKTLNILNLSEKQVKSFYQEENSPRHVFAILELKKNSIQHFTTKKIFNMISSISKRNAIQVLNFDYALPTSYNPSTKGLIINLKPFEVIEIANMSPNDLYASIVYAYSFSMLVTKKFKISESYIKPIIDFLLSFYVRMFGREYGLVGIYSTEIAKLKFLLTCYILSAYFGYAQNKQMYTKAYSLAPHSFQEYASELQKYNFVNIEDFIKAISDLKVMPGLSLAKFTQKVYRFYGINMLPAIEDCSRFFSVILTSSIPGTRVAPRHLIDNNRNAYFQLIEIMRKMF